MTNLATRLRVKNPLAREFFAELLGSLILIVMGDGAVAQFVLSNPPGNDSKMSTFLSVNFGYALAVAFAVYVCGGVSGGHINPAVTLGMAVIGRLKWVKVPVYMLAQYLGCFLGSAIVFGVYRDLIDHYAKSALETTGDLATAGIFATYPNPNVTITTALGDQILGTALLLIFVLALTDGKNSGPNKGFVPLLVGLAVLAIGLSFGVNAGYAINPARDLGPRLFTLICGYGSQTFTSFSSYFWVPIVGPHLGAIIGIFVYLALIENHWPDEDESYEIPSPEKYNEMRLTTV